MKDYVKHVAGWRRCLQGHPTNRKGKPDTGT